MSQNSTFDLLIIGSGPAGQRAAIQAAKLGKRTAIIEKNKVVGGVALHTGTIPSKTLRETILYLTGWDQRSFYGHDYRLKQDISVEDLRQRLEITIQHEMDIIHDQLKRNNVEVIHGTASFLNANSINIEQDNGKTSSLTAHNFLIATGTQPRRPSDVPFDNSAILDADDLLSASTLPASITIIGAGVIGIEYATMLSALDINVTLINENPQILPFVDREIIDDFLEYQSGYGMSIITGKKILSINKAVSGSVTTKLEDGSEHESEGLLFTAGRSGCTSSLNLENAGLSANKKGLISVDSNYKTSVPHIYAAGDVIGFPSLASTSAEQGRLVALIAFGHTANCNMTIIPFGIYSVPEISMIGKTETDCKNENISFIVGRAKFEETARGQILGLKSGMLKLIINTANSKLLGVHIVGYGATELIHIGQSVMMLDGKLDYFLNNVFNYPTISGAYKVAALDAWNRLP